MSRFAKAFSPGSVGNIGVGFDIIGHGIAGIGDIATVRRIDEPTVRITAIRGTVTIAGYSYDTAYAMEIVDPDAYQEMIDGFISSMEFVSE